MKKKKEILTRPIWEHTHTHTQICRHKTRTHIHTHTYTNTYGHAPRQTHRHRHPSKHFQTHMYTHTNTYTITTCTYATLPRITLYLSMKLPPVSFVMKFPSSIPVEAPPPPTRPKSVFFLMDSASPFDEWGLRSVFLMLNRSDVAFISDWFGREVGIV